MGALQDQRAARRPHRNLGTPVCSRRDASSPRLESGTAGSANALIAPDNNTAALQTRRNSSEYVLNMPPSRPTEPATCSTLDCQQARKTRDRCRREQCVEARSKLSSALTELAMKKNELDRERAARQSYLAGDMRRYEQSDYKDLQDLLNSERVFYEKLKIANKQYLAQAKQLGLERQQLLEEIAQLKGDLLMVRAEVAEYARAEERSVRMMEREIKLANYEKRKAQTL